MEQTHNRRDKAMLRAERTVQYFCRRGLKGWAAFIALQIGITQAHGTDLIFSQYVETESGTTPKGVEVWNTSGATIDFSATPLVIEKGTNGGVPSPDFTLSEGTLAAGEVIVIGTSDMNPAHEKGFTFNGDDALVLTLGGITNDVFGIPGSDPGSAWTNNSVSTANQNIQLKEGITTGATDGWTDPSIRFETVSETPSLAGGLLGFGVPPGASSLQAFPAAISSLNYLMGEGPSTAQSYTLSGADLEGPGNITVTAPANFEIATAIGGPYGSSLSLPFAGGQLTGQPVSIFARLAAGLALGPYSGNITHTGGGVAAPYSVAVAGEVTSPVTGIVLSNGSYNQDFDAIGSGLPAGVRIVTGATLDSNGTDESFEPSRQSWGNTDGAFKNLASAEGLSSNAVADAQHTSENRALGIRTTGSFADSGAAFIFTINDTLYYENISVALDLLMLDVEGRSQVWTIDYRVGTSDNFTLLGTWPDPGTWGTTPFSATLGSNARNQPQPVEIRVVCLEVSTGDGSRDTIAVDNLVLTADSTPKPTVLVLW